MRCPRCDADTPDGTRFCIECGTPLTPLCPQCGAVQAVLAARLDRLPPEEKQLLQTAAVIGTEVPLTLLQVMAEVPEEPLRLGVTHLQAAEFLYETRLFCHAELGAFAEGRVLGEEGLRIAEAVDHPTSLRTALWGIGLLALRQGDLRRALPRRERALSICQDADLPGYFPLMAAALGAAYTLGGRAADAIELYRAMDMTFWLPQTEAALAQVEGR